MAQATGEAKTGQQVLAEVLRDEKFEGIFAVAGKPLTKSEELLVEWGAARWVNHEAVAVQMALGVAGYGGKSAAMMKQVGMQAAMDMITCASAVRSGGAMLLIIGDDPGAYTSQCEGDCRVLARYADLPCVEPTGAEDLPSAVAEGLALSAHMRTPVVLRITVQMQNRPVVARPLDRPIPLTLRPFDPTLAWTTDFAGARKRVVADLLSLSEEGTTARRRSGAASLRIVAAGEPAALAQAAADVDLLAVRRPVPMPRNAIRDFVETGNGAILVLENGHPVLEEVVRELAGGRRVWGRYTGHVPWAGDFDVPATIEAAREGRTIPDPGPKFVDGDPNADLSGYGSLLDDAAALGLLPASSDAGMASGGGYLPGHPTPFSYGWGSPLGVSAGIALKTGKPALALAGDGGMFHSGLVGLLQIVRDQLPVITVVLDDGANGYTGGQPNPGSDPRPGQRRVSLEQLARGAGVDQVESIDHAQATSDLLRPLLSRLMASGKPSMVIINKRT